MEVAFSGFLSSIKPKLKILLKHLLQDYSYVSILATDCLGKQYHISKSGTQIADDTTFGSQGAVIRIYDNKGYLEYSFNDFSPAFLEKIPEYIKNHLVPLGDCFPKKPYDYISEDIVSFSKATTYEIDPIVLEDSDIIQRLSDIRKRVLQAHTEIIDCICRFSYLQSSKLFLSRNRDLEQAVLHSSSALIPMVKKQEEIKDYYCSYSALGGAEILDAMEQDCMKTADIVLDLIHSESITPGLYDVICAPDVTGMIAHEAFGHGVEMDMFVKDRALAKEYMNQPVASVLVTMHDGAAAAKEAGSYFFDDEGTLAKDTTIIRQGNLEHGLCDLLSSLALTTEPTGNGRRESFERKAYTRMTNTFFEPGDSSLEEMIASIDYGFYIENAMSGMEDPKNWGIQCMVNIAREIKDGSFTGKVFSPVVLTGYVPDLLKSISMVSNTLTLNGSGYCGKGYKEWVKVSDGGPAIKAKVKLG